MEQIWTSLLQFIEKLVSPDWGALVALIPLIVMGLVGLYLLWLLWAWSHVGPKRTGRRPLPPRPPAGVHAAERSWAPLIASLGVFMLFYGLVFGGVVLAAGVAVLVIALLYWLREGMRDYDHVEHPVTALVPVAAMGPPPGVHVPGPSFRPILASIALAVLFYGLVFGPWVLAAGGIMLAIALLQWLVDARREYRGAVSADVTGHLPADPIPGYPVATLAVFAVLLIGAIVLQAGILPPKSGTATTGGAAASGAPASPGASGGAPASGGAGSPSAPGAGEAADVTVIAENVAFVGGTTEQHTAPAGKPFAIKFENRDAGIPHNISIRDGGASGPELWKGDIFPGVETRIYQVTPLKAGSYTFICDVHPTMTGTIVVQ